MKAIFKWLLGASAALCVGVGVGLQSTPAIAEGATSNTIDALVTEINNEKLDNGNCFVMVLSDNDYMTAEGWNNFNYKWKNAEEVTDRTSLDLSAVNMCNAQLDKNLEEYNFEEYIFVDGVSLAEFSKTNAYSLFANKRQRINTLSIDFASGVLSGVDTIKIEEGCQLPTLLYSYLGAGEFSCIEIQESVIFQNNNGEWRTIFEGYEEGVEYAGDKENLQLSLDKTYKGHTAVPLDAYTNFFMNNAVQNEFINNEALVSVSNTEKGNLMVLKFINPIDVEQFNRIHLRVYINHQVDVLTYNANAITEESVGSALEKYTVGGGQFTYLTLNSLLYADEDNTVSTIVFQFAQDCQPQYQNGNILYDAEGNIIRDTFFFISFHLENKKDVELVSEDSFMIVDEGDSYAISFRFDKTGSFDNGVLDMEKVLLNGCSVADILSECETATAEWYPAKGVYQINLSIPKSYTGAAQIKNAEYGFTGNNMTVEEGLVFPNGDVLDKKYTCHLYMGENLLDTELIEEYQPVSVEEVRFSFIEDSQNLNFTIYFSGNITTSLYNHACERESWRSDEETKDIIDYDKGSTDIFIAGGFKASLLDNIAINGRTIGEWHAHDASALTNVQVHYGVALEMNRLDIRFEAASPTTYNQLYDLVVAGEGVTIDIFDGLKFMTSRAVVKDQTFVMNGGVFTEEIVSAQLHVYFNGGKVQNGQEVKVQTVVSSDSIFVEGVQEYTVTCVDGNGKKVYTIAYGESETFVFTVIEDIVETPAQTDGEGCFSHLGWCSMTILLLCAAALFGVKGGKRHENE